MSTQATSHNDNMPPRASMTRVATRNTSRKRLQGNADAPDDNNNRNNNNESWNTSRKRLRGNADAPDDNNNNKNNNNNENGSDPEQSETLGFVEAATPFFGLLTKLAGKADLALIERSVASLREDVKQRVTLEDSKKVNEKIETILKTSTAEYTELKRKIDRLVNQMDEERKERAKLEEEVRGLRQDLNVAKTTRQKDKEEFKELVTTLRKEREAEKRAHTKTAAQLIKKGDELGKLEAEMATVKNIQDTLTSKVNEDQRAAEERLEEVRKNFEDCTAQLDIRLTENGKALIRYGKDVNNYTDMIDPISKNIDTLKEELANHHRSLQDEIQEHFVQAKVHTDKAMRQVDVNSINRERSIWDCIDLVKTSPVGVLETQMHESQAQQGRLAAEQNDIKKELGTQKKQHDTLKTLVEESRKEVDERHDTVAVMVHKHDSFLKNFPRY